MFSPRVLILLWLVGCQAGTPPPGSGRTAPEEVPSTGDAGPSEASDAARTPLDAGPRPAADPCGDGIDGDGNGLIDEGCSCEPGRTQPCYPSGMVGVCGGVQTCVVEEEFGSWGECEGMVAPSEELCGDGIDQDCDGVDPACERPTDLCEHGTRIRETIRRAFPNPLETLGPCPWREGDNLDHRRGGMAARHEVTRSLDLPAEAVICSMDFTVPETGMYYDDTMFVLMNDFVILAPWDPGVYLETRDGLLIYDWTLLRGQGLGEAQPYCPGESSTCGLPDTQRDGSIHLDLDDETVRTLGDLAASEDRAEFTVVATGDDDPSVDCTHSSFNIEVNVEYVVR